MATILILWLLILHIVSALEFSPESAIVYGHGVEEKSSLLPINYFYLQAVDRNENK